MPVQAANDAFPFAADPIRCVTSIDGTVSVFGPMSDAVHAMSWGKLMVSNQVEPGAERVTASELEDFIAFNIIDRVIGSSRHKYEAGAARWAGRQMAVAA